MASLLLCTREEFRDASGGRSFWGQDLQKRARRLVFRKGRGSGVPVQVQACATVSDKEGGVEPKKGKVLS